ncbi:MAG: CBS domain-containing protein [gamma proteobacterium endosymbiont of Lamellibrachia anaximandri]|nr:CBS domain-containing protein [gamma proteobacterium endosymbiont of Lamellibrachia anaximandri]MBL3616449.1 CBS domain-containing protein [gamma proteobacterium endosymbiont of Lamellibrachia anaximandri]
MKPVKTLADLLTSSVVTVSPETPLAVALHTLVEKSISCLVVKEDDLPVGIITERDLVRHASSVADIQRHLVGSVMSTDLVTALQTLDYREGYERFAENKIRHLVVVDDSGRLAGIVTETDIMRHMGLEHFLQYTGLSSIMTRGVVTFSPKATLDQVMKRMTSARISCIIVEENGFPVGIVTERDAVRQMDAGIDFSLVPLEQVMTSPVQTVDTGIGIHEASVRMQKLGIRRLVAVDKAGKLEGLVTEHDVVKGVHGKYVELLKEVIASQAGTLKQVRKQLSEKNLLDNLLRSYSDIAVISTDLDYRITFCNQLAERLLGYSQDEVYGQKLTEVLSRSDMDAGIFKQGTRLVPGMGSYDYPITRKGEARTEYFDARVFGIWDDTHQLAGFVLTMKDITAKQQAEIALRESEARLNSMFRNAAAGMAMADFPGGRFTRVNPELCSMLGYSEEELLSKSMLDVIYPDDREASRARISDALKEQVSGYQVEVCHQRKDGSPVWCLVSMGYIRDEAGTKSSGVALLQDITEKRRAEQRRLAQQNAVTREVHHRIKNHLQGVIGLLRERSQQHSNVYDILNDAISQVESVALVHGLLGRQQDRVLDFAEMLEGIVASVEFLTDIVIERCSVTEPVQDCRVVEDKSVAIALVINELLINAAKHGDKTISPPPVEVTAQWQGENRLLLSVSNRGCLPEAFDFATGVGFGTGLELVKSMLPSRGARLSVAQEGDVVLATLMLEAPVISLQKRSTESAPTVSEPNPS